MAARAWNAFTVLDTLRAGELDAREIALLLQLRDHAEPKEGVAENLLQSMGFALDKRVVSLAAWLEASLQEPGHG